METHRATRVSITAEKLIQDGITRIIEEEGAVGLPPNRVPMLTFAGEKLLPSWSEKLISGKLGYRVREHFRVQMPGFPARGSAIAKGIAQVHGFGLTENEMLTPIASEIAKGKQKDDR